VIIKKRTTLAAAGGIALSLALAASSVQAEGTAEDVQADPTVAGEDALSAEAVEMGGDELEEGAVAVKEGAEDMGDDLKEGADDAMGTIEDALDDGALAAKLQQDIATDERFGSYGIEVTDVDGRYMVTGMIDKAEDYAALQEMLADVDGIDPATIDNNVVQN